MDASEKDPGRPDTMPGEAGEEGTVHFLKEIVEQDLREGKHQTVRTRFPPEPNGYLHIGHAKAICLNFGLALDYGGTCNLRFDDTNPAREETEYVESIKADVRWLGFDWQEREYYASDYFDQLHAWAVDLIKRGKAYVCDLSADEISEYRGSFYKPGTESPYRNRSVEENLELFERMRRGELPDGSKTLRAKIDMAHPNMNMRDPPLYRIKKVSHHRTGDKWCIYPMYDFAHGQCDAIERITHSICTLEFEAHKPLYDWFIENLPVPARPRQYEFARLALTYTVMSKRRLLQLVQNRLVSGWDDPRMPTLAAYRRRGYTPEAIRAFCDRVGVARRDSVVDVALLENAIRDDLEKRAPRRLAVLRPLRIIIDNYPEGEVEELEAPNHPDDPAMGARKIPFCRELYIERDDFREDPPKKWFRLAPGREIRLRYACLITCTRVVKDDKGEVTELHCTWDPASRGGNAPDGRKVKGTSHWVSARHAVAGEARLYDRLFLNENPMEGGDEGFMKSLNPDSLEVLGGCMLEPSLATAGPGERFQFERLGYFCVDRDSTPARPVFNRTVQLKDSWAKIEKTLKQRG